ncbi:hypothetical protein [Dentiradicibacter hellwigii]|jgi:hypothetical protein|uniref:Uncharacterized protein n=1 Tax=Dentiradicibacter hellwigii TaxID=3149053 RepID=A0ABV4UDE9_9RHOO
MGLIADGQVELRANYALENGVPGVESVTKVKQDKTVKGGKFRKTRKGTERQGKHHVRFCIELRQFFL